MKKIMPFIILLVAFAVYWSQRPPAPRDRMSYAGVVEVTTINQSFEISGTLKSVEVREGQTIHKGQVLARLDDATAQANLAQAMARQGTARARLDQLLAGNRPAEIAQAEARLAQAQAELQQLENGVTQEELKSAQAAMQASQLRASNVQEGSRQEDIAAALSQVAGARSSFRTAQIDLERYRRLRREGAISDQTLEVRKNLYDTTLAAYQISQDNYNRLRSGPRKQERSAAWADYRVSQARFQDLARGTRPELLAKSRATVAERAQALQVMRDGPRKEEIQAARQQLAEAKAAVEGAQVQLGKTEIHSTTDGVVLVRNLEPGESVNPGLAVVSIGDLAHPWVNIYVPEYELPQIKLGQQASVSADGLKKSLQGSITRIHEKPEYTPKFIQTPRERVHLVFRAKVEFDNSELGLHPGMPADVLLVR